MAGAFPNKKTAALRVKSGGKVIGEEDARQAWLARRRA